MPTEVAVFNYCTPLAETALELLTRRERKKAENIIRLVSEAISEKGKLLLHLK